MINFFKKKPIYKKGETIIHGHRFTVLDPFTMPKVRQAAYHLNEYEKGWGITKQNLINTFEALKKETAFPNSYGGQDDLVAKLTDKLKDMSGICEMLLLVIQQDYQYDPFIKSACNVILLDDEKADVIDPEYTKKKLQLCQKHEEIMVFFLITERHSMQNIETIYDILKDSEQFSYPRMDKLKEKRLLSMIRQ